MKERKGVFMKHRVMCHSAM